jgi:NAD(P)-dependent dehydrogenase (short-subunit alcohol dehydrogenase family)
MSRKHALVIGGTRGTGRVMARTFANAGYAVSVIGSRQPVQADRGAANVRHWTVDISDAPALEAALKDIISKNGKLDSLVFFQRYRGTGDAWAGEMAASLTATRNIIERLAGSFRSAGDKAIVIVGSIASRLIATEQPVGYHVAKGGMLQMARYYALALGPKGVRVNFISPGTIMKEEARDFYMRNARLQRLYKQIIPLGRMGTSQEVADIVEFLCSPKASFITGQDIVADGGLSLQWHESMARGLTALRNLKVARQPAKNSR